jgi:hypothetical protein
VYYGWNSRENLKKAAGERGARNDRARVENAYKVEDRVLRVNNVLSDASLGFSSGLAHAYEGPYVISKRVGKNVFDLVTLDDVPAGRRHVDALRPYCEQPEWAQKQRENNIPDSVRDVSNDITDDDLGVSSGDGKLQRPKRKIVRPARFLD